MSPRPTKPRALDHRAAGILLHLTSLPGPHGSGDLGPAATGFVDWLAAAGQSWWQMLPINPPAEGLSPYSPISAFAGNPDLISLERLHEAGLLDRADLAPPKSFSPRKIRFPTVQRWRAQRLHQAFLRFQARRRGKGAYHAWCRQAADWLDDYALFAALRTHHDDQPWQTWPQPVRARQPAALRAAGANLATDIDYHRFEQFIFHQQWRALRQYARRHHVGLIGDLPIFVGAESADVWANPQLFQLRSNGRPARVTGVPPDAFSETGQLWSHPQYEWLRHTRTGFAWWQQRLARILELFDVVRVDHFLGFARLWSIPGNAKTAKNGRWVKTPGRRLFAKLTERFGPLPIIAEDLGLLTAEAARLRDDCGFPGMRLMQWGFDNDTGSRYHQPHAFPPHCVAYTGTHDNDTTVGWLRDLRRQGRTRRPNNEELTPIERVKQYCDHHPDLRHELLRLGYLSSANLVIYPLQDILGRDSRARINTPATTRGNWSWRLESLAELRSTTRQLNQWAHRYDRAPRQSR